MSRRVGLALDRRRANEGRGELWEDPPRFWAGRTGILLRAVPVPRMRDPQTLPSRSCDTASCGGCARLTCQGVLLADDFLLAPDPESWVAELDGLRSGTWVLALSASYVCAIVLLFRRPAWRRLLHVFAPVGRMALTNYLGQSSSASLSSTGWGSVGTAASVPPPRLWCPSASSWYRRSSARGGSTCSGSGRSCAWRSLTSGRSPPWRATDRLTTVIFRRSRAAAEPGR